MGAGRGERENRDLLPAPPLLAAGAESLQKEDPPSRSQRKGAGPSSAVRC